MSIKDIIILRDVRKAVVTKYEQHLETGCPCNRPGPYDDNSLYNIWMNERDRLTERITSIENEIVDVVTKAGNDLWKEGE